MSIQVTSDLVKSAISKKLSTSFPNTDVYKEQVVEGISYPSFFINQITLTPVKLYRDKYIYEFLMEVDYFLEPKSLNRYKNLDNVGCELLDVLETIYVENIPIKGRYMNSQKVDDVMVTTVTYKLPVTEQRIKGITMAHLDINEYVGDIPHTEPEPNEPDDTGDLDNSEDNN